MSIQQLADQMNIHPADVECFAKLIVDQLKQDKVDQFFIDAEESVQFDFIQAYSKAAQKKTDQFVNAYLTAGREAFQSHVWNELKSR